MIKGGGYEMVGVLDMIQPHEPNCNWDYSSLGFPSSNPFPKPATAADNHHHHHGLRGVVNLERNELSEWVQHVTKQLTDDLPDTPPPGPDQGTTTFPPPASYRTSNAGVDHFRPGKVMRMTTRHEDYSVDQTNYSPDSYRLGHAEMPLSKSDERSLGLITQLLEIAVAISVENLGEAHEMLLDLSHVASPYGPSCAERVVAYFATAMSSRLTNSWLGICSPLNNHRSLHAAFQVFNTVSPFVKLAHFTSNQAILEAFQGRDRVHILDLDIMQGLQWPALFHILAKRAEGPPQVRMTGMGPSMDLLVKTGRQVSSFARRLGLPFEFHPVAGKFGDASTVSMRHGETLAVHWMQHSLYDAVGTDWKAMRLLEELAPRVVTLVEQDVAHGPVGSFLDRFRGSLHYYSTLYDSLGAFLAPDDPGRHKVEHCLLFREINNMVAIGGPGRSEEEKFNCWRSELLFRSQLLQVPMSGNAMAQAQLILNMFPSVHGYSLVQGDGTLRLGWKDTSLFTVSAWTSPSSR